MILRNLDEIINSERDVLWGNGNSRRLLLDKDQMSYSLTDTVINAGTESRLQYPRHLETCYCVSGEGELEVNGTRHRLRPGVMYALDQHEPHVLRARTEMRLICVFSPALQGSESHNLTGDTVSSY